MKRNFKLLCSLVAVFALFLVLGQFMPKAKAEGEGYLVDLSDKDNAQDEIKQVRSQLKYEEETNTYAVRFVTEVKVNYAEGNYSLIENRIYGYNISLHDLNNEHQKQYTYYLENYYQTINAGDSVASPSEGYLFVAYGVNNIPADLLNNVVFEVTPFLIDTVEDSQTVLKGTSRTIYLQELLGKTLFNGNFEYGLAGWTMTGDIGTIETNETYWTGYHVFNQGNYFRGDGKEGNTGSLISPTFVVDATNRAISLRLGASLDPEQVYVEVIDCDNNNEVLAKITNTKFNDPYYALALNYYSVTLDEAVVGHRVCLKLTDNATSGFGFANLDDIKVNQSTSDLEASLNEHNELLKAFIHENELNASNASILEQVNYLKSLVYADNMLENYGFENGTLNGWTTTNENWGKNENGSLQGASSSSTWWGEALTFNKSGNYFLNGFESTGMAEGETWTLKSTSFVLSGAGYISVKMGGRAASVNVYDAENNTLIGTYKQTRFNNANFPCINLGGSWYDMAVYVIDLREYVGKTLYVELCDTETENFGCSTFDNIITYYETDFDIIAERISNDELYDTTVAPIERVDGNITYGDVQIKWVMAVKTA